MLWSSARWDALLVDCPVRAYGCEDANISKVRGLTCRHKLAACGGCSDASKLLLLTIAFVQCADSGVVACRYCTHRLACWCLTSCAIKCPSPMPAGSLLVCWDAWVWRVTMMSRALRRCGSAGHIVGCMVGWGLMSALCGCHTLNVCSCECLLSCDADRCF